MGKVYRYGESDAGRVAEFCDDDGFGYDGFTELPGVFCGVEDDCDGSWCCEVEGDVFSRRGELVGCVEVVGVVVLGVVVG